MHGKVKFLSEKCQNKEMTLSEVYSDSSAIVFIKKKIMGLELLLKEIRHILKNHVRLLKALKEKNHSWIFEFQSNFE